MIEKFITELWSHILLILLLLVVVIVEVVVLHPTYGRGSRKIILTLV